MENFDHKTAEGQLASDKAAGDSSAGNKSAFADELHSILRDNASKTTVDRVAAVETPPPPQSVPNLQIQPEVQAAPAPVAAPATPGAIQPVDFLIGTNDYKLVFGPDGQTNNLSFQTPDGTSSLQIARDADGTLRVTNATGALQPHDGVIAIEGLPLHVDPDGRVHGDISFDVTGALKIKESNEPLAKEWDRNADGTLVEYDLKNWTKTIASPDGQKQQLFWDGWEWRAGQPTPDGSRVNFAPPDPIKPSFIQFDRSSGALKTTIGMTNGITYTCDFEHQTMTETMPSMNGQPGESYTMYSNGSTYEEAQQVQTDVPGPGDTTVTFLNPQTGKPTQSVIHKGGGNTATFADGTTVDKDPEGYVTSVNGPRGMWNFKQDVNGDVEAVMHTYAGPDGKPVTDTLMRSGPEQNPGLNHWVSRFGHGNPRMPDDKPPFDINKPVGFDTFVDQNGNAVQMNIAVESDGAVRMTKLGADSAPVVSFQLPYDLPPPQPTPGPDQSVQPAPQQTDAQPAPQQQTDAQPAPQPQPEVQADPNQQPAPASG